MSEGDIKLPPTTQFKQIIYLKANIQSSSRANTHALCLSLESRPDTKTKFKEKTPCT